MKIVATAILTTIAVLVFVSPVITHQNKQLEIAYNMYEIQQVCDTSRVSDDGYLEQTCADLQEEYYMQYMCTKTPNRQCWVEAK